MDKDSLLIGEWLAYNREDNHIADSIVDILKDVQHQSLLRYPLSDNLIGVFWADLLKFAAGTVLRARELKKSLVIQHPDLLSPLGGWPYLGYAEILDPKLLDRPLRGKKIKYSRISRVKFLISILSRFSFWAGKNKKIFLFFPEASGMTTVIPFCLRGHEIRFIDQNWRPHFIDLSQQLMFVRTFLERVEAKHGFPIPSAKAFKLIEKYITDILSPQPSPPLPAHDFFVMESGTELKNRLAAAQSKAHGKTIAIIHGESFGAIDNEVFGELEQSLADVVIGYGQNAKHEESRFLHRPGIRYYWGSSLKIRQLIARKKTISQQATVSSRFYYCPTSLRGKKDRYGLYQDLVDHYYLDWQKKLSTIFGKNLIYKVHPKDDYLTVALDYLKPSHVNKKNVYDLLAEVDVFVFDYISTAFCLAAASDRPIIFLDLGIQSFGSKVVESLKSRCVYVDVTRDGLPTLGELLDRVKQEEKSYDFSWRYSLSKSYPDRFSHFLNSLDSTGGAA